jgi:hypothetical protein
MGQMGLCSSPAGAQLWLQLNRQGRALLSYAAVSAARNQAALAQVYWAVSWSAASKSDHPRVVTLFHPHH